MGENPVRNREAMFGKYRLLHLLGRGRHTVVWLGEHIHLKKKVAIKILFPEAIQGIGEQHHAKRRFLKEARTLAQFDHPHIVQVFDSGEVDGLLYFAMEYAPYGSLARRYRLGERLPLPRVRLYTGQLGRAIYYVHTQGLIHRDIKPQNMLLKARNRALLGDFGLVMPIQREYYPRMFWEFGGTRAYMAPEQQQGAPCPASDQYAFAMIIFEWLTGYSPFLGVDEEITWQRRYLKLVFENIAFPTKISL